MHQGYQNSGAADLAQLQATMQAIELACSSIQMHMNPAAAEETILSLSQSPQPYHACKYILENSQLANARFQAAGAIRDAALREWVFLEIDDKRGLISFCFHSAIQHASSPEGYVQAKVASVAAQLIKRGWIEFSAAQKETFFLEVRQAIVGGHGLDVQFIGLNFLESLVSEFSPSTSIAMALPREFHEQCRVSFELEYLKLFYCWAQDAAVSVSNKIAESEAAIPEVKVCTAALRLMLQILNWDFKCDANVPDKAKRGINIFSAGVRGDVSSPKRTECNLVQPGSSWRGILVSSGHIGWLLSFYEALRQKFSCEGYWIDCPLAVSARKLIVQFYSLWGTIFPSDDGNTQKQHLLHLLSGIIAWIDPPDVVSTAIVNGKSESEFLDGCRALLYMATVTTVLVFDELLKSIRPYGTLSLLSALMCEVIKDLMANHTEEETWSWVARDILLDTWTTLLMPLDGSISHAVIPSEGIGAASHLFALIVESELRAASASAFNDENETDYLQASIAAMDERLSSYALIARAAINVTVPFLIRLFSEKFARLQQGRGFSDPTQTLEELYSLLLITGHVIADEGQGETPLVPDAIQFQFMDVMETDKHPVVILCGSVIKFAEQSLNPEMRASFFSPRLMEAIVWFLARWSTTYLMPPDENKGSASSENHKAKHYKKVLLNFCEEDNQGKAVLDLILHISKTTLTSYPGERDLQALTCHELLHGLVRRKNVCVHLVELDSWRELANAFANEQTLFSLNAAHQRSLAQTLVLSASGMKTLEASSQYVRNLTNHMAANLVELSSRSDLKCVAEQPDIILLVSCLLERLRGAASATEPRTQRAIYEMGYSVLNPLLMFMEVYKHESTVVYLLLRFVVDWVDGQIIYLEAHETAIVVGFCMRLLQLYSSHNIGKDHALWKDVIISKCGQTEQWTTNTVTNTYGVSVWRTIRNLWPKLSGSIGYKVGEGTRILFWKDKWIGQNSLMEDFSDLFSFCGSPEVSIAETWTNQGWNIIFRRLLNDWEVERVASLLQRLNDFSGLNSSPGTIRWKHDRDGKFSVGRLYRRNLSSQPGNIPGPWKQIWKSNIPTKIKCFIWMVCRRVCLTLEKLKKRSFEIVSRCFSCKEKEETNSQLFLHCRVTSQVWHMFLNFLQQPWVMPEHTADLLTCWMRRGGSKKQKNCWSIVPSCIWWSIWKERNNRCFENITNPMQKVKENCINTLYLLV